MSEHYIDEKGREVGRCDYCLRVGLAKNLKELPVKYRGNVKLEYCPKCYDDVLNEVKKLPWNKDK